MPVSPRTRTQQKQNVEYRNLDLLGFPGYRVGSNGSVWSCFRRIAHPSGNGSIAVPGEVWKQLHPSVNNGYYQLMLYNAGKSRLMLVHRLVLLAFVGPCPDGEECRHKDGNRGNNYIGNLYWGIPKRNKEDDIHNGMRRFGEKSSNATLTEQQAMEIISLRRSNPKLWSYRKLARKYEVSHKTIMCVVSGKTWPYLPR